MLLGRKSNLVNLFKHFIYMVLIRIIHEVSTILTTSLCGFIYEIRLMVKFGILGFFVEKFGQCLCYVF